MNELDFVSRAASVIDHAVPVILVLVAVATLTGNFAAKRFFDGCGLGLRSRYGGAAAFGLLGLAFAGGFRSGYASMFMIAMLVVLVVMACRAGSGRSAMTMSLLATALLAVEVTA